MTSKQLFDSVRSEKAPQRIIGQIRSAILEGKLTPGDKLPTEQELTEHFGVSRQTLREALRSLEILGLLEIRAGSGGGAFVCEVDLETAKENLANFLYFKNMSIGHISEIRKVLEPFAARLAVARMTEEELDELRGIHAQCELVLEEGRYEDLMVLGVSFHRIIANATHNPILILILEAIENLLTEMKRILRIDANFSNRFIQCHEKVIEALAARDADLAEREMYADVFGVEEEMMRLAQNQSNNRWT